MRNVRHCHVPLHILALAALCVSGCAGFDATQHPDLVRHAVSLDADGWPYCPVTERSYRYDVTRVAGSGPLIPRDSGGAANTFDEYMANLFYHMDRYFAATGGKRKILFYVHGGRNRPQESLHRTHVLSDLIQYDSAADDAHYPIFISWPSGFWDTYAEALFEVRSGEKLDHIGPALTGPGSILYDLGLGLVRLPVTLFNQTAVDLTPAESIDTEAAAIPAAGPAIPNPPILGTYRDNRSFPVALWEAICYPTQLPAKMLTTVLVDRPGGTGWHNMQRRSRKLIRQPGEYRSDHPFESTPTGGLAVFFQSLAEHIAAHPEVEYEVTLVGHSLGTCVINDLLADGGENLPVTNIVYMSAACSLQDANTILVPYLRRHQQAKLYLLMLNPVAEARERFLDQWYVPFLGEPLPKGSLLEWIDNYYEIQHSHLDRTLGKWNNVIPAKHIFADVANRVYMKAFDVDVASGSLPQKHAHLNHLPFWRKKYWDSRELAIDIPREDGQLEGYYYAGWLDTEAYLESVAARKAQVEAAMGAQPEGS